MRHWTKAENKQLKTNFYAGLSDEQQAQAFGRSVHAVRLHRAKLRLSTRQRKAATTPPRTEAFTRGRFGNHAENSSPAWA